MSSQTDRSVAGAETDEELPADSLSRDTRSALNHYEALLDRNPNSFWGHYRAAVVCFRLRRWSEAANHLEHCVRRRQGNAILHGQMAACLSQIGLADLAGQECDRALELAPELGEFYRTRAFIRARQGRTSDLQDDLARFELFGRSLARTFFRNPPSQGLGDLRLASVPASQRILDLNSSPNFLARAGDPLAQPERLDREELNARAVLATVISKAGADSLRERGTSAAEGANSPKTIALAIAAGELDKVLKAEPDYLPARLVRMIQSLEEGRLQEARQDLELILIAPQLSALLREDPECARFLAFTTYRLARRGLTESAVRLGRKLVVLCMELHIPRGQAYYYLAKARSVAARADAEQIEQAAENLQYAITAHRRFRDWYRNDHVFDPVRTQIDAALDRLSDPIQSY
jgi:tetratricopeptide (TPR) repeat protein